MTTGDTTPADGTSGPSSLQTVRRVATAPTVGPFFALVLTMAFFTFESDRFLQTENLSLVLQQMMVVGVLAIGQTLVILTAGIDLSVGTVMALGQVVMTKLAIASGVPALPALLIGILTCVAFGVVNGGLITLVRLPAFIVTLGTLNIAFALTHIVSNDETYTGLPSVLLFFGRTFTVAGAAFTYGVVFMLLLYAVGLVRAHPDRLGATRLRGRRQPRGRAADRASTPTGSCSACTRSPVSPRVSRRCSSSGARRSEIRTPGRRPRTSTASPRSCSAARACSAAAERSSAR